MTRHHNGLWPEDARASCASPLQVERCTIAPPVAAPEPVFDNLLAQSKYILEDMWKIRDRLANIRARFVGVIPTGDGTAKSTQDPGSVSERFRDVLGYQSVTVGQIFEEISRLESL
jgi:hypothetical protein